MTGGSDHDPGDDPATGPGQCTRRRVGRSRCRPALGRASSPIAARGPVAAVGWSRSSSPSCGGWACRPRSPGPRRPARPWCSGLRDEGGCRCLVAVGGDGTVSALVNERPEPPLTVMPAGTENLVARHFGLRGDPHGLARTIAAGRSVPVDVGQAAGRRFLLMAGFGFDADVVTRHHRRRVSGSGGIRPTSRMAYVEHVLRSSFSYRFPTISVRILDPGAEEVAARHDRVHLQPAPLCPGAAVRPVAREDDGWLDLIVFRHPGPFQAFYYLCKVFCGIHLHDPSVSHRRVRKAVVTSAGDDPGPARRRPRRLRAARRHRAAGRRRLRMGTPSPRPATGRSPGRTSASGGVDRRDPALGA